MSRFTSNIVRLPGAPPSGRGAGRQKAQRLQVLLRAWGGQEAWYPECPVSQKPFQDILRWSTNPREFGDVAFKSCGAGRKRRHLRWGRRHSAPALPGWRRRSLAVSSTISTVESHPVSSAQECPLSRSWRASRVQQASPVCSSINYMLPRNYILALRVGADGN